jgi:hypothetical protein
VRLENHANFTLMRIKQTETKTNKTAKTAKLIKPAVAVIPCGEGPAELTDLGRSAGPMTAAEFLAELQHPQSQKRSLTKAEARTEAPAEPILSDATAGEVGSAARVHRLVM